MRQSNDAGGTAIEEKFNPLEERYRSAGLKRTDGHDRTRPQIAELQDERKTSRRCKRPASDSGEELRRGGDDDIGSLRNQPREIGAEHEAEEIEGAAHESLVFGDEGLDPHNLDVVAPLTLVPAVPVARKQLSLGEVRCGRQHRDAVTPARPIDGALVNPRCRRIALRREIVT